MSPKVIVLALGLAGVAVGASAAEPPAKADASALPAALPPPSLEDPGVKTAPEPAATADTPAAGAARNKRGEAAPDVSIRQEGDDTIEEYRTSGRVTMIRISRKGGVQQTFIDTDGDGRLEGNPKEGPVAPVYYKLYEWN
ncbi:DUF2782 domain-containing protein [Tahibacter amnicola]|uniref:DUF2782 domain-containing protein n=1 Tax=Tahibacter amnicola TaxID=2976241 RepID=A0ABY6BG02_9GAMM|nr:DUF2782 domain-containing protein [Tahibacter amnicola]UXI68694.1 DUF2782 domain-containing protein [Tahibacter amnicola]